VPPVTPTPTPQGILPGAALEACATGRNAAAATNLASRALSIVSRRAAANAVQTALRRSCPALTAPERRTATVAILAALEIKADDLEPGAAAAQADRML
jgi:hypothetical protein